MAVMAKWRDKTWEVSHNKVLAIENLAFSYEQKADNNNAAEGAPLTNERGMELFSLSFSCVLHANAGISVEKEIQSWRGLVTKTGPFFLNGVQIGPVLQLSKVSVGSVILDDFGRIRLCTLSFAFNEMGEPDKSSPTSTSALSVGPSSSTKADVKPENPQVSAAPVVTTYSDYEQRMRLFQMR